MIAVLLFFKYDLALEHVSSTAYDLGVEQTTLLFGGCVGIIFCMMLAKLIWHLILRYKAQKVKQGLKDAILARERDALLVIYKSLGGDKWKKNANWCVGHDIGTWKGVKLNHSTGRVNKILLPDNNLCGELPEEIRVFEELIEIDIRRNNIKGVIPEGICSLQKLEGLYLFENYLEGTIPDDICRLPNIKGIYLLNNNFKNIERTKTLFRDTLGPDCIIYI